MKILKGGSAEVAPNRWKKFDIELDESDLQAIVVKNNIDYAQLTVGQKYNLLVKQAEILISVQFESEGLRGEESSVAVMAKFQKILETMPRKES